MPRVGDKEFPYTDDGMRQAQIHANRTGQSVTYPENNKRFGYQTGGMANSTGDLGSKARKFLNRGEEMSQDNALKRQFMSEHGKMPSDVEEPPSLLEENRMFELAEQLAGPPPWIRNWRQSMEEPSYMPYRGYQEGGVAVPMGTYDQGGDWMSADQLRAARVRGAEELARHKEKYADYYELKHRLDTEGVDYEKYPDDEPGYQYPETGKFSDGVYERLRKLQRQMMDMQRAEGTLRNTKIPELRRPEIEFEKPEKQRW